jgi:hypothetical protein
LGEDEVGDEWKQVRPTRWKRIKNWFWQRWVWFDVRVLGPIDRLLAKLLNRD